MRVLGVCGLLLCYFAVGAAAAYFADATSAKDAFAWQGVFGESAKQYLNSEQRASQRQSPEISSGSVATRCASELARAAPQGHCPARSARMLDRPSAARGYVISKPRPADELELPPAPPGPRIRPAAPRRHLGNNCRYARALSQAFPRGR